MTAGVRPPGSAKAFAGAALVKGDPAKLQGLADKSPTSPSASTTGSPAATRASKSPERAAPAMKAPTFAEQLSAAQGALRKMLEAGEAELTAGFNGKEPGRPSDEFLQLRSMSSKLVERLGQGVLKLVGQLSEAHQATARAQLKEQSIAFDAKLTHARTASQVSMRNQAAEMESMLAQRVAERVRALTGSSATAHAELQDMLDQATAELANLRVKSSTLEENLNIARDLLRESESSASQLQGEVARCERMLEKALEDLDVHYEANRSLEERVSEFVHQCDKQHTEITDARDEIDAVLKELDIAIDEKRSLKEQVCVMGEHVHVHGHMHARSRSRCA